jgi:DNA modification methylase
LTKRQQAIALVREWQIETLHSEWSFHQLSPYIGKVKSSLAKGLIENFTQEGNIVYDPFCGAGTIPFEAWCLKRQVIANDLNPYAHVLVKAKLFPIDSIQTALKILEGKQSEVNLTYDGIDLRKVPKWVRAFFHKKTLKEIIAWCEVLKSSEQWFLLACLLGILHHQRPGFLSFPSSHTVPYLRTKKYPKDKFPYMYSYRSVRERLEKKIIRAFKRQPVLVKSIKRNCYNSDCSKLIINTKVDAIITSPPYMRQLDYARDNRLRLWFLGFTDWQTLDRKISPSEKDFLDQMRENLHQWKDILNNKGKCILILGDALCKTYNLSLPDVIEEIAINEIGGYKLIQKIDNIIPEAKRVRKGHKGSNKETILIMEKYDKKNQSKS